MKLSAILNGMVIGYLISLALGMVSFEPVQMLKSFRLITPFHFGLDFQLVPIFTLVVMFIVDAVQAIGQFTATTVGAMDRDATDEELSGGIMGSGFTNFIGSLFGSIPVATFGQNVGLVTVTKVINKYVLVFASVILLIAGFCSESSCIINYNSLRGNWWRNDFSFCFYFYDRYSDDCFAGNDSSKYWGCRKQL